MLPPSVFLNTCPDAVLICDQSGIIAQWNDAASRLLGWTAPEAEGQSFVDLIVPDELRDPIRMTYARVFSEPQLNQDRRKVTVQTRNRIRLPVELWFRHLNVGSGEQFAVAYLRPISDPNYVESRRARISLESRLFDHSERGDGEDESFEHALQGALDTFCEVSSWPIGHAFVLTETEQELISSGKWSLLRPEEVDQFRRQRQLRRIHIGEGLVGQVWQSTEPEWQLLRDAPPGSGDELLLLPENVVSHFCLPVVVGRRVVAVLEFFSRKRSRPSRGVENLVRRLARMLGHVIERQNWQEDRQRLAAIVESSYDGIISKDITGVITSWNVGAERLYGYSQEEAIGRRAEDLILPDTMAREESEIAEAIKTGKRLEQFETRRRRKDGEILSVSLTVSPLRSPRGRIIGSAFIARDITRRRRSQQQLQEAIVAAEQANRTKSEFMANISHELRTPMNAILGMTDLALQEQLPDLVRDYLVTARDSADTMLFLINDILDFSRLEAGRFELDPTAFDIRRLLQETMRTLSLRAHEKGLELAAHVDPDVPLRLVGDPLRLKQIMTNLVGNAIKFTESGEVVISVGVNDEEIDHARDWLAGDPVHLVIQVRDTGIGISQADQVRIFSPFTQADASTTRTYAGTGLGLSICVELARLMKGNLTVESEPGEGSCFSCTAVLEVAPATDGDAGNSAVDLNRLKGKSVLVVDDNETTRQIIEEMLSSWQINVTAAESAAAALNYLRHADQRNEGYEMMLIDAVMPHTDGIELVERLQKSKMQPSSIIMMLASADQHLFRNRAENLNIDAFLDKPVSQSNLLQSIGDALNCNFAIQEVAAPIAAATRTLELLVADDIAANQKVVAAILAKRGHHVTIAHNGREAIDLIQRQTFDVVLMDVQMPIMDGLQATRIIRKNEGSNGKRLPIIAMTAHAMRGDREACLQAGMDAYLAKPLDSERLVKMVESLAAGVRSLPPSERSIFQDSQVFERPVDPVPSLEDIADVTQETASKQQSDLWKVDVALKRLGDDRELLQNMIGYFLEDAPELLGKLPSLVETRDWDEATRAAHSLKGLCSNFEAVTVTDTAREMEHACRARNGEVAEELLPTLSQQVEDLKTSLTNWSDNV